MIDVDYCQTMAKYNQWMNRRLYALCAELSDGDRRQPANPVNRADNQPITLPTIARQMRHIVSWDMV
jgi:uncharacterized damage-inducible protein DinB